MAIVIDIETVPKPHADIVAAMPEAIKNPIIPDALKNPSEPDWEADCPAYNVPALTEKLLAAKNALAKVPEDEAAPDKLTLAEQKAADALREAEGKRSSWIAEKRDAWRAKNESAIAKINADAEAERLKFIDGAALDARLCFVKLIGVRDTATKTTTVFVFEPDKARVGMLTEYAKNGRVGKAVIVAPSMLERQMLKAFFRHFEKAMAQTDARDFQPTECVTYFGNGWDFPMLYRKAWINGIAIDPLFRRGRYFTDRMVDLHERWQLGDNRASVGGLDGLAETLGVPQAKLGDGASFHKFYDADPTEGLAYLLGDLDVTEECARRMGVAL